jgi:membrane protease YdiL (CAAX protease family)
MWPLFVGFFAAVFAMLAANVALAAVIVAVFASTAPDMQGALEASGKWITSIGGLAASAAATGGSIAFVALLIPRLLKEPVAESLSLGPSTLRARHIAAVALATFAAGVVYGQVTDMFGYGDVGVLAQITKSIREASWLAWAVSTLGLALVPGLAEELFFRGFIQTRAQVRWGKPTGIVVAALLFGLFHLDPKQGLYAALVGLLLGWVATRAKSIRPSMVAHGISNFIGLTMAKLGHENATTTKTRIIAIVVALAIVAGAVAFVARATRPAPSPPAPS